MDRTETRFRGLGQILGKIMTSCQPHPQDEEQSPQLSTSGYPRQEVVDNEVLGPSASGVDPSPPCRSLCWKRKREWSDKSEESSEEEPEKELAPEPEETWVVETVCGLKMKLKQQLVSSVLPEHHEDFNRLPAPGVDPSPPCRSLCWKRKREWSDESEDSSEEEPEKELAPEPEETWVAEMLYTLLLAALLLPQKPCPASHADICSLITEDPVIKRFLAWDKDLRMSDKYLLAMVIAYFSRAGLFSWQYQRIHFFLPLHFSLGNRARLFLKKKKKKPKKQIPTPNKTKGTINQPGLSEIPWFRRRRTSFSLTNSLPRTRRHVLRKACFISSVPVLSFHELQGWVSLEELEEAVQAMTSEHWVWAARSRHLS
uniref:Uncharacterized protein n=1 Tax=Rhinopithecus bieti TaxID=61621 RepID=A0A2K6M4P3_RHIBE